MNQLIKWTLVFAALMIAMKSGHAWTIGSKGSVAGPIVHITYFLTPYNEPVKVHAEGYLGSFINSTCQYNKIYDFGVDTLKTGDMVYIDGFALKTIIGTNYDCVTIYYTYKQLVMETIVLYFDGLNYVNSYPPTSEVTIL